MGYILLERRGFMEECEFCRIVKGEKRAEIIYEDELVVSFMDIDPISRGSSPGAQGRPG